MLSCYHHVTDTRLGGLDHQAEECLGGGEKVEGGGIQPSPRLFLSSLACLPACIIIKITFLE